MRFGLSEPGALCLQGRNFPRYRAPALLAASRIFPRFSDKVDCAGHACSKVGAGGAIRNLRAPPHHAGAFVQQGSTFPNAATEGDHTGAERVFAFRAHPLQRENAHIPLRFRLTCPRSTFGSIPFGLRQHIPEVSKAVAEIHRVLHPLPSAKCLVMVLQQEFDQYVVEILFLRKLPAASCRCRAAMPLPAWAVDVPPPEAWSATRAAPGQKQAD